MILFATNMIKIGLPLIVLGIVWILLRQKLSDKVLFEITVLTIFASFVFNWLAGFLSPLTDKVILTALGEQQSNAESSEVFLTGYTIDGKSFTSGKSLEIDEGHWFWSGETYAWRPETDLRQPDGVTRTVVLKIPVGWLRTLDFSGSPYGGYVKISTSEKEWVVDTYKENNSEVLIEIGRSETLILIANQIRYLLLYSFLLLIWYIVGFFIIYATLHSRNHARTWFEHNIGKLIYLGISIITFCLMFYYANRFSLWYDELCQVYFTKNSLTEAFLSCLKLYDCSPPLALISSALWYHIAPYGEQWLLLIAMILSALSIYIIGLAGEEIENVYCGILATILMAFSTTVWLNAAYEYRSYPYFLMFSTLSLYLYIQKNKTNRHLGWAIAFSVSLTCLAMTHYFGMLVCGVYFFGDLFLWYKKQIKWQEGFLYLLPGVCSVSWLLAVRFYQGESYISYLQWQPVPDASDIKTLLMFLTGDIEIFYLVLLIAIANCIICYLEDKRDNRQDFLWPIFYQRFFVSEIVITIALVYIYGAYINQESTLWSDRYFMFLLPVVIIISAKIFYDFSVLLGNNRRVKKVIALFLGLSLFLNCLIFISTSTSQSLDSFAVRNTKKTSEPFKEAANWLYQQSDDIFNDTTLIVTSYGNWFTEGWIEYYITRQGRYDTLNIIDQSELNQDEVLKYNKIYVVGTASSWFKTFLDEKYIMSENYQSSLRMRSYIKK